jgi:hypothetical protein
MVKTKIEALRAANEKGDYLRVQTAAAVLEKELAGLPEGDESAKLRASVAADAKAQDVIKGQQKLAKIAARAEQPQGARGRDRGPAQAQGRPSRHLRREAGRGADQPLLRMSNR